jgi:hypothetical protein
VQHLSAGRKDARPVPADDRLKRGRVATVAEPGEQVVIREGGELGRVEGATECSDESRERGGGHGRASGWGTLLYM